MTDSVREVLARAFNGKCGESIYRSETAMTSEDAQEEVQSGIDHLLDALKAAGLTIEPDWNTDMDAAPKDGTHLLLAFSDGEVWTGGYSEHDNGWMTGACGYPMVDNAMDDAHKCLLLIVAWKPITPHEGG